MESSMEWIPSEILSSIREELKGARSIQDIRSIVVQATRCKPGDIKDFHYKLGGHDWKGVIYTKRNTLMGSVFSLFDSKPFVVRGYPKIRYALDSKLLGKEVTVQMKYDGTNIGLFLLPNGEIMGKTRLMPRWDVQSLQAMKRQVSHWKELFTKIDDGYLLKQVKYLAEDDYMIFGELYGYLNPGEFIKYSIPIAFKAFDIVDTRTLKFLSSKDMEDLCYELDIPYVEELWHGILTRKEVERIEYEAKQYVREDGYEGFVAKHFSPIDNDMHFCKLKCEEIKEKAWKLRPTGIPISIIRKAIRKAMESYPYYDKVDQLYPVVREELLEEVEPSLVDESENKIRSVIRRVLSPTPEELKKSIREIMLELRERGMDLNKKGEVLPALAHRLGDISGKMLYRLYTQVLFEMESEV